MTTFNLALVGYGAVTTAHIKALSMIENVKIVALVSEHLSVEKHCSFLQDLPVYKTLKDLLSADSRNEINIDVVDICSRPDLHAQQAIEAANAGKHLIIEKPLALTLTDCYAVNKAVQSNQVQVCICYECRYSEQFLKTKEAISKYLGEISHTTIGYFHGIGPNNPQYHWNKTLKSGGNSLLSAGCHALDGVLFFMGKNLESVYSLSTQQKHADYVAYEYDPIQTVLLKFADGRTATIHSNIAYWGNYDFPIHISGTEGSLENNKVYLASGTTMTLDMKLLKSGDPLDHPYFSLFSDFFNALANNHAMPNTNLTEALMTHQVIEAASLSLTKKRPILLTELQKE